MICPQSGYSTVSTVLLRAQAEAMHGLTGEHFLSVPMSAFFATFMGQ
jgi:hypothetical protein